jgi:modulator of FtsH protease HflC
MRLSIIFVFAVVIVLGFITFMLTYTVRFTEVGVVTTFGSASEDNIVRDAGLKWRLPYPIQGVTKYDTRVRLLQARSETQQTADNRQVVVEAFVTWRVTDPLKFYQSFGNSGPESRDHYRAAERLIENQLRSGMSEISAYRFDELFSTTDSKLGELESVLLDRLHRVDGSDRGVDDFGVEAVFVGINRIVLPQETTGAVFDRMKAQRDRLAAEAKSKGEALAQTIINDADSAAARIRAFAKQRAEEIRVRGELEAARYYAQLNEEKSLAIFIDQLEFMKSLLGKRATLVLSTNQMGLGIFSPDALSNLDEAGVPAFDPQAAVEGANK